MVEERSVGRWRGIVKSPGDIRSANADKSNVNTGENPVRRKSKVFYAILISVELAVPKARPKGVVDGQQVNIPVLYIVTMECEESYVMPVIGFR